MKAGRISWALVVLALAGCDDRIGDYPALLPTEQILADPALPGHAADTAKDPSATTDSLRARAAGLNAGAPPVMAQDAELARRAAALRTRAAKLAKTPLDACPEGAPSCDASIPTARDQKE